MSEQMSDPKEGNMAQNNDDLRVVWAFRLPSSNLTFFGYAEKPMDALAEARMSGRSFTRTPGVVAVRSLDVDFHLMKRTEAMKMMGHDPIVEEKWKLLFKDAAAGKAPETDEEKEAARAAKLPTRSDLGSYIKKAAVEEFDQDAQVEIIQGYKNQD